ncbi:hypothetical protein F2Q69_00029073 [Brassica cretica]|uniref:Uncharacterized protein n=1 Tax=Brassica cretica TaxID=69181 RepID=A0A8S9S646_BRACR|nr:hypothetical protein F2Q69_00029073 [Brassica cretica]
MSSSFSLVSLKNIHNLCVSTFSSLFLRVLPIGTLSTSIESSPSSKGILTVSRGFSEGVGLGLSSLRRATFIFGICTRYLIGARRSMDAGVFLRRALVGWSRLNSSIFGNMEGSPYQKFSISRRKGGDPGTGPGKLHRGEPGFLLAGILGTRVPSSGDPEAVSCLGSGRNSIPEYFSPNRLPFRQDIALVIPLSQVLDSLYIVFLRRALVGWSRLNSSIFGNMEGSPYQKFSISRRKGGDPGTGPGKLHRGEPGFLLAGILGTRVPSSGDPEAVSCLGSGRNSIPEYFSPNRLPFRQDIALVIPLSQVPPRPEPYSEPGG